MQLRKQNMLRNKKTLLNSRKGRSYIEFLYILPFLILVALFSYYPFYGWVYAFHYFDPSKSIDAGTWAGLKWFLDIVNNPTHLREIGRVLRNTFVMSGISLFFSWFPMVFAVFLNEIRCRRYRKFVQTVTALPNFISWVLVYAFAFNLFSPSGAVNRVILDLGLSQEAIPFLKSTDGIWIKMWLWSTWKNAGWAAILYLASISRIDGEMFEAARVDGASRLQIIRHITIPSLLPVYFVLLMLNLAGFLSNGMEQFFVFQNDFNVEFVEVLDLYVYNMPVSNAAMYPLSTAISILKSIVSVVLLCATNTVSKLIRREGFI